MRPFRIQDLHHAQDMQKEFIIFIKMSASNKLTVSIASNMQAIIRNHKRNAAPNNGSSSKIVYYEVRQNRRQALARERELKNLNRKGLDLLVRMSNPEMLDLSSTWEERSFFSQDALGL